MRQRWAEVFLDAGLGVNCSWKIEYLLSETVPDEFQFLGFSLTPPQSAGSSATNSHPVYFVQVEIEQDPTDTASSQEQDQTETVPSQEQEQTKTVPSQEQDHTEIASPQEQDQTEIIPPLEQLHESTEGATVKTDSPPGGINVLPVPPKPGTGHNTHKHVELATHTTPRGKRGLTTHMLLPNPDKSRHVPKGIEPGQLNYRREQYRLQQTALKKLIKSGRLKKMAF